MRINSNLVGTKVNNIEIVNYFSQGKRQYFECICFCGASFKIRCDSLKENGTQSCGCIKGDLVSLKNRLADNLGAFNLICRTYKSGAAKRNLDFLLSVEEFRELIFNSCYYCGAEPTLSKLTTSQKNRRHREITYNGIDRIDNSVGYTSSNCVTCCSICNGAKSDLSFEEFNNWIKRLVSNYGK